MSRCGTCIYEKQAWYNEPCDSCSVSHPGYVNVGDTLCGTCTKMTSEREVMYGKPYIFRFFCTLSSEPTWPTETCDKWRGQGE